MTTFLQFLNVSAPAAFEKFVWPMLWQSSLLIGGLFVLDRLLRDRLRPAVRYSFWLVVLLKLLLPPSLALPTSLAWWIRPAAAPANAVRRTSVVVTYGPPTAAGAATPAADVLPPPGAPRLPVSAWALLFSTAVSAGLLGMMLVRWREIARMANEASPAPPALTEVLEKASRRTCASRRIRLRLTDRRMSPALCGFLRPVILLPRALAEALSEGQLEAVLVHELIHLRRRDVWLNALQAVVQAAYWWHPLLWLANARIRRLREQAVDDAVMLALRDDAETYGPTLLEVARLALTRPLPSLGLVGIFESKTALRERILRLEDFHPPRHAGLTFLSGLGLVAFAITALPMESGPGRLGEPPIAAVVSDGDWPDPRFLGYSNLDLRARFFTANEPSLRSVIPVAGNYFGVLNSNQLFGLQGRLREAGATEVSETGQVQFQSFSGGHFSWIIGASVNNEVRYPTRTVGARTIVSGAEARFIATQLGWVPIELQVVPWLDDGSIRCQVALGPAFSPLLPEWSETVFPANGALLWVKTDGMPTGKCQIVVLHNSPQLPGEPEELRAITPRLPFQEGLKASPDPAASGQANTLVQNGRLLFESGKLSEAEALLDQAVKEDANSLSAHYYLNLIRESRVGTNSLNSSTSPRRAIVAKLNSIRFNISFDHLPLTEVVAKLNDEVKRFDPEKHGINFIIINKNAGSKSTGAIDPTTSIPVAALAPAEQVDIGRISVNIVPALNDVRLADVLDAIVKVADRPIKYSIEDYGVVFSEKGTNEPPPLYVRIIKMDPSTILDGLPKLEDMQSAIRDYFAKQGVNFEPPKSLFFNPRDDTLIVRATLEDLALVEIEVAALKDVKPPQILIEARFMEVPRTSTAAIRHDLGLDTLGEEMLAKVLTTKQVLTFLRTAELDTNFNLLSESRVTTLPARQAEMQVVDVKTVVTGIDPKALTPPGVAGTDVPYITTNMAFGPILDIVPYLAANGSDIEITATASLLEFLGYDKPDREVPVYVGGKTIKGVVPLPHIRVRKMMTSERLLVQNGWSILLANPVYESGRPAEEDATISKSLFVLITPTLLDPAGNLITK